MTLMRLGFALVLVIAAAWLLTHHEMIELGTIEPALRSLGIWAPVGFVVVYAIGTVLFFSGALLRGSFQNSRASRPATRNMQALCSSDWMMKPCRS